MAARWRASLSPLCIDINLATRDRYWIRTCDKEIQTMGANLTNDDKLKNGEHDEIGDEL